MIFRKSASAKLKKTYKDKLDSNQVIDYNEMNVHIAALLLKEYIRDYPDGIIDSKLPIFSFSKNSSYAVDELAELLAEVEVEAFLPTVFFTFGAPPSRNEDRCTVLSFWMLYHCNCFCLDNAFPLKDI